MKHLASFILIATASIFSSLLAGCVAAALAPAAMQGFSLANGVRENNVKVTVDEKSVTPEIKNAFLSSKTLSVVAGERAHVRAADMFETLGGYIVSIDRPTVKNGEMTGSERREALRKICSNSRPDLAILGRVLKTESNNNLVAAVTGRANIKQDWSMDMLVCRSNSAYTFGGNFELDAGIYNSKPMETEEKIGEEIATKILAVVGRDKNSLAVQDSSSINNSNNPSAPLAKDEKNIFMSTIDIQKKLVELGYMKGRADGVMGKQSTDALKKFQKDNGLLQSGKPDQDTVTKLSEAAQAK